MTNVVQQANGVHKNVWRLAFVFTALLYLITLFSAPYSGQFAVKALPILLLVFASYHFLSGNLQKLMLTALVCSAIGDVFLAPSAAYNFIAGLGAFLIAQLIYCRVFHHFKTPSPSISQWGQAIGLIIYAVAMSLLVLPDTGDLMIPVVVYLLVISAMGVLVLLSQCHLLAKLGALAFVCSDSILAWGLFKTPLPANDLWVMLTYYAAQGFILMGIIKTSKNSAQLVNQTHN